MSDGSVVGRGDRPEFAVAVRLEAQASYPIATALPGLVAAATIAIFFLCVYGGIKPFTDERVDAFATFAQLMTFLQLFIALLLYFGVGDSGNMGVLMVVVTILATCFTGVDKVRT